MKKEMLMNVLQPEESRIAIVEDGTLQELYVERNSLENYVGNIYKGRVVNIEPSIQAAFVDFGVGRNGFLHVSDVEYQYYKHLVDGKETDDGDGEDGDEDEGRPARSPRGKFNERSVRNKPPIQDTLKRGSEVLVQVIKGAIGSKGLLGVLDAAPEVTINLDGSVSVRLRQRVPHIFGRAIPGTADDTVVNAVATAHVRQR